MARRSSGRKSRGNTPYVIPPRTSRQVNSLSLRGSSTTYFVIQGYVSSSYLAKCRKLLLGQLTFPMLASRSVGIRNRNHTVSRYHAVMAQANIAFYCEVDAEPSERYREGGYHPIHLGDRFKDGRYKIIHKLVWGADATVWLAKDLL